MQSQLSTNYSNNKLTISVQSSALYQITIGSLIELQGAIKWFDNLQQIYDYLQN